MMDGRQKDRRADRQFGRCGCDASSEKEERGSGIHDSRDEVDRSSCHGGAKRGASEGLCGAEATGMAPATAVRLV